MTTADRTSWKMLPPPERRAKLAIPDLLSDAEGERIRQGFIPKDMDDRWFVYFEDGWVNFHRSWTGSHIFALRLDGSPNGVRVVDGWVSRNEDEYSSRDIERDRQTVRQLIKSLFGDEAQVRS